MSRILLTLGVGALVAFGSAQAGDSRWRVDATQGLVWGGQPYQPVGLRIPGDAKSIEGAAKAGVLDVLVELPLDPAVWTSAVAALEKSNMRYVLAVNDLPSGCVGMTIEPEGYRIPHFSGEKFLEFPLPGADWVYGVLVYTRDAAAAQSFRVDTKAGFLSTRVKAEGESDQTLLLFPYGRELHVPDYWEEFDSWRDRLLRCVIQSKIGPGCRGLLNPLGNVPQYQTPRFVPGSPLFRRELELFLKQKYSSLNTAMRAWSVSAGDFVSFQEMATLVPLWSENRGLGLLYDARRNTTFKTDPGRSAAWADIFQVIRSGASRRYGRLVGAIQQLVDIPVIQEWRGWEGPYSVNSNLAGIGLPLHSEVAEPLAAELGPAVATASAWGKPSWLVGTDFSPRNRESLQVAVQATANMGMRAWFVRADPTILHDIQVSVSAAPRIVPFPAGALNPVQPGRLPSGQILLAGPGAGNRLDLGSGLVGYRYSGLDGAYFALWASTGTPSRRIKFLTNVPETWQFESTSGVDPAPRMLKGGVEVTVSQHPLLIRGTDELPVAEESVAEALGQWETLRVQAGGGTTEDGLAFADAVKGLPRNPSGSFAVMREILARANTGIAPFNWIEAESSRDHSFSEVSQVSGCSGGRAILLRSQLPSDLFPMQASYTFEPRTSATHTIWLSARIAPEARNKVRVRVGEQVLAASYQAGTDYGLGYAWYEIGQVNLERGAPITLKFEVAGLKAVELALDTWMITPNNFVPRGPICPNVIPVTRIGKK